MTRFGSWLREQREYRGWSRAELAAFTATDVASVKRWEQGQHPRLSTFARLCRLLNADANHVLRLVSDLHQDTDAEAA